MKLTVQLRLMRSPRQRRGNRLASSATVRRSKRGIVLKQRNFHCFGLPRIELFSAYGTVAGINHLAVNICLHARAGA
jgi:hypothetical protein